jgi:hypothetical protein
VQYWQLIQHLSRPAGRWMESAVPRRSNSGVLLGLKSLLDKEKCLWISLIHSQSPVGGNRVARMRQACTQIKY